MKILIVSEFFPLSKKAEISGGVETRAYYVAKILSKKHSVTVLTSLVQGSKKKENFGNFNVIRCGKKRKYSQKDAFFDRLSFMIDAYKIGKKLDFDIVDGYNFISYAPAYWIAKSKNKISIATYHDVWINQWVKNIGITGLSMEILERYVLSRKWTGFITNSEFTKNNLTKVGIKKNIIDTVYSGVELKKYEKLKVKKFKDPTITTVARLVNYKRVNDLIDAIFIVKNKIPFVKCNIIGDGPERRNLESQAKKLGLENNINFMGYVNHGKVIETLKKSHLFCLPSIVEGMGLVTVEAMACGTPYVNSRIAPQVEVTKNGVGGILYTPKKSKELANGITSLIINERLYDKKKKESLNLAKEFDWDVVVKKIEEVYSKLC